MTRTCPDCNLPLARQNFHGVELDACKVCAGLFFDEGEIAEVRRVSPSSFEELDARFQSEEAPHRFEEHETRLCPQCRLPMSQYRYLYSSAIMLDCCTQCNGMWIENGELKAMAEFIRNCQDDAQEKVVAQMKAANIQEIHRAKVSERAMRYLSRRMSAPN